MKSFLTQNRLSKRTSIFAALAGVALFFSACKHDNYYYDTPGIAAATIYNAVPSTNNLDFYLGEKKVNNTPLAYGLVTDPFTAYSGSRKATVALAGTQTNLVSKSLDIVTGNYYSLYIIGKQTDALDLLLVRDNTSAANPPGESKSKIRFINLSPDAPALSLEVVGATEPAFDNIAYKSNSDFKPFNAAKSTIVLKNKATNTELARLTDVDLKSNYIYTVWAKGLVTPTGTADAIALQIATTFRP